MITKLRKWLERLFGLKKSHREKIRKVETDIQKKQMEIRRSIAEITTEKKRLDFKISQLNETIDNQYKKAEKEVLDNNIDEAKKYIRKKQKNEQKLRDIKNQRQNIDNILSELDKTKKKLEYKIDDIRTKRFNTQVRKKALETEIMVSKAISDINSTEHDDSMRELQKKIDELEYKSEEIEYEETSEKYDKYQVEEEITDIKENT